MVIFSKKEKNTISDIQKKIVEALAEFSEFEVLRQIYCTQMALALALANMMITFGIQETDLFLKDLTVLAQDLFRDVKKNPSGYVIFKKGKKIDEGSFH